MIRMLVRVWLCLGLAATGLAASAWTKARIGPFTVIADGSEKAARNWALELEQFRHGLQMILSIPPERQRPVTVVLFKNDKAFRDYKPLENGKPKMLAGVFVNTGDTHTIGLANDHDVAAARALVFHEAVHWFSSAADQRMPDWLEEGVAEVYSTFQVKDGRLCTFGKVIDGHVARVRRDRPLPVRELMTLRREDLHYNRGDKAERFYASAWLFTHYLLYGRETPGRESIAAYLEALHAGSDLESAFVRAFGASYDEFDRRLAAYIRRGSYSLFTYELPATGLERSLALSRATEGDVELALGSLLLGTRPEARDRITRHLERATRLQPDDARAWQVLGTAAVRADDWSTATGHFANAARLGSDSYYVYYGLAHGRLASQMDHEGSIVTGNESDMAKSVADLRRAIALNPRFLPAYENLAGLLAGLEKMDPVDRELLSQGRRLAPDNLRLDLGLATFDLRSGLRLRARERLQMIMAEAAGTPDGRKIARAAEHLLLSDDWNEGMRMMDEKFRAGDLRSVLALVETLEPKFTDSRYRQVLAINRKRAEGYLRIQSAVEQLNAGKKAEGVAALEAVAADSDDSMVKNEAARLLREVRKSQGKSTAR